jgi:hypothetical protein
MDELIKMIADKVGLDEATASKVAVFIKEHMHEIPGMLGGAGLDGLKDQAGGLLGGFLGGGDKQD